MKVRIAGIIPDSLTNGPGIRMVIFSQGCKHHCKECHNPHTWDLGKGYEIEIDELEQIIKRNKLISGVTLSGGDPFEQEDSFYVLCRRLKRLGLNIWCYTGYTFEKIKDSKLLGAIDVLVDGKFEKGNTLNAKKFTGSANQRIIDVGESVKSGKVIEIGC